MVAAAVADIAEITAVNLYIDEMKPTLIASPIVNSASKFHFIGASLRARGDRQMNIHANVDNAREDPTTA